MSSLVHPRGAENTAIGPMPSFVLRFFKRSTILWIPFPCLSMRLPPNFATESVFNIDTLRVYRLAGLFGFKKFPFLIEA